MRILTLLLLSACALPARAYPVHPLEDAVIHWDSVRSEVVSPAPQKSYVLSVDMDGDAFWTESSDAPSPLVRTYIVRSMEPYRPDPRALGGGWEIFAPGLQVPPHGYIPSWLHELARPREKGFDLRTLLFTPEDRAALVIGPPRMDPEDVTIQWAERWCL